MAFRKKDMGYYIDRGLPIPPYLLHGEITSQPDIAPVMNEEKKLKEINLKFIRDQAERTRRQHALAEKMKFDRSYNN